jgi:hypothetical protein
MAVPAGESHWTLFLFRGSDSPAAEESLRTSDLVPQGFRRLLGLRGQTGELILGISGKGVADDWKKSLETTFEERGWRRSGEWLLANRSWSAEFVSRDSTDVTTWRIVMTSDGNDGWTGLIQHAP